MTIVYLNGEFLAIEQAKVSVLDRGFLFGDGIYEIIPFNQQRLFRASIHLRRLAYGLKEVSLDISQDHTELSAILQQVITKNNLVAGQLYLQVTRGEQAVRSFLPTAPIKPTLLIMPMSYPDYTAQRTGIRAITAEDFRWQRCDIKSISLIANVMYYQQAQRQQVEELILIKDNYVTEGASCNVFIVKDDKIITPEKAKSMLEGVARDVIIDVARAHNISCTEDKISLQQLQAADEIWVTNSIYDIIPVIELNQQQVNNGLPGPMWQKMLNLIRVAKQVDA